MLPLLSAGMMPGFLFPMPIPTPDYPPPEAGDAPADGAGTPGEESAAGDAPQSLTMLLSLGFGSVCHGLYGYRARFCAVLQCVLVELIIHRSFLPVSETVLWS